MKYVLMPVEAAESRLLPIECTLRLAILLRDTPCDMNPAKTSVGCMPRLVVLL